VVEEAHLEDTESGLRPTGEGWFVVNARDAKWTGGEPFGAQCAFEGPWPAASFGQLGVKLCVLQPGQPNCVYHRESQQEDFLVLTGECLLVVEEQERPLRAWDFVHCPPDTAHVFVGAGEGPCVILMVGARLDDEGLFFPVSEIARRYGASVEQETGSGDEAYVRGFPGRAPGRPDSWDELPWVRPS
jgi:uncharacterized cupin superfamily protein